MAQPNVRQDLTAARLAGATVPESGAWLAKARSEALARLNAMGLPLRRDEYWRYTNPGDLTAATAPKAAVFEADEAPVFDAVDRLKVVFVDGVFDAEASDDLEMAGIEIDRLETAGAVDIHWARDLYGVLEARGQDPVHRPLAALNSALASDGILIRATAKAAKPVFIKLPMNAN